MNKKGQSLIGLGILIVLAIVSVFLLSFNNTIKFTVLGFGLIAGGFIVLLKQEVKIKQSTRKFFFILLLGGGLVLLISPNILQSFQSYSAIPLDQNGQIIWTYTGVADNVDEGFTFNLKPSTYTSPTDGSQTTPQKSLTLTIVKAIDKTTRKPLSYCDYSVSKVTTKVGIGQTFSYYVLANPQRTANIEIIDAFGNSKIIDGTIINDFSFPHNGGSVGVRTLGINGGKTDCPNYQGVAVVYDEATRNYEFLDKSALDNFITQFGSSLYTNAFSYSKVIANVRTDNVFKTDFLSKPEFNLVLVRGQIDLGFVEFRVTADSKYFESTYIKPATAPKPSIQNVDAPSPLNEKTEGLLTFDVVNSGGKGQILVTLTDGSWSYSRNSFNDAIDKKNSYSIKLKANDDLGNHCGNIKVCGQGSLSTENCDTEKFCINLVANVVDVETIPEDTSGQTVAQPNNTALVCGFGEKLVSTQETVGKGWFGIGKVIGLTDTVSKQECKTADWVGYLIIGAIISGLGFYAIQSSKPKRRR